jgi:hypothetical protein
MESEEARKVRKDGNTLIRLKKELGKIAEKDRAVFRAGYQAGLDQAERNEFPWRFRDNNQTKT